MGHSCARRRAPSARGRPLVRPPRGRLALTFDDGPDPVYTPALLEVLARHGVAATFFLIGRSVRARPDLARAIAAAGHTIGNHTQTHPDLVGLAHEDALDEIAACAGTLAAFVGSHSALVRAPYFKTTPALEIDLSAMGLRFTGATCAPNDWVPQTAKRLLARIINGHRGKKRAIIALHDGDHTGLGADRGPTVEATELVIQHFRSERYEFADAGELLAEGLS